MSDDRHTSARNAPEVAIAPDPARAPASASAAAPARVRAHEPISNRANLETATSGPWCRTCGTRHAVSMCSRDYSSTGTERHGWRVLIEGKEYPEVYGVLIAPWGHLWRARILTYPNVVWMIPGGGTTMKFLGMSAAQAEAEAVQFIQDFCKTRGVKISRRLPNLDPGPVDHEENEQTKADAAAQAARRRLRHVPLWWGKNSADEPGLSEDLSESGLFLISGKLQPKGSKLKLRIRVADTMVELTGTVAWTRDLASNGRRIGMGIELKSPPQAYKEFVRGLP